MKTSPVRVFMPVALLLLLTSSPFHHQAQERGPRSRALLVGTDSCPYFPKSRLRDRKKTQPRTGW